MATLGGFYLDPHRSQYDPDSTALTRSMGCGPTTGANGANASTGGRISRTAQAIHDLLPRSEESDPNTLGWSLVDIGKAVGKLGVDFENRTNTGWAGLISALNAGLYVALQGDSDQFSNNTCSGDFNGDHVVGIHPAWRVVGGLTQHWIDDPICPNGRWEYDYILRRYAAKLSGSTANARFGVFVHGVPKPVVPPAPPAVTLRYGGLLESRPTVHIISVPAGQKANVRSRPTTSAGRVALMANGEAFTVYQATKTGQVLVGSPVWYGDKTGTRWLHISAF